MQIRARDGSTTARRAAAALVCVLALCFALYAGALGGLRHAAAFTADRTGDLVSRPHTAPAASPASPMWLTVPCRRMLIWPARIDQIAWCSRPGHG